MATQVDLNFQGPNDKDKNTEKPRKIQQGVYEYGGKHITRKNNKWEMADPWDVNPTPEIFKTLSAAMEKIAQDQLKQRRSQEMLNQITPDDPALIAVDKKTYHYRDAYINKVTGGYRIPNDPTTHKSLFHATQRLDEIHSQRKITQQAAPFVVPPPLTPDISLSPEDSEESFWDERRQRFDDLQDQKRAVLESYRQTNSDVRRQLRLRREEIQRRMADVREEGAKSRVGLYGIASSVRLPGYVVSSLTDKGSLQPQRQLELDSLKDELNKLKDTFKSINDTVAKTKAGYIQEYAESYRSIHRSRPDTGFLPGSEIPATPQFRSVVKNILSPGTPPEDVIDASLAPKLRGLPHYPHVSRLVPPNANAGTGLIKSKYPDAVYIGEAQDTGMSFGIPNISGGGTGGTVPPGGAAAAGGAGGWRAFGSKLGSAVTSGAIPIAAAAYIGIEIDRKLGKSLDNVTRFTTSNIRSIGTGDAFNQLQVPIQGVKSALDSLPFMPETVKAVISAPVEVYGAVLDNMNMTLNRFVSSSIGFAPQSLNATVEAKLRMLEFDINAASQLDPTVAAIISAKSDLEVTMRQVSNDILVTFGPLLIIMVDVARVGILIFKQTYDLMFAISNYMTKGILNAALQWYLATKKAQQSAVINSVLKQTQQFFTGKP